MRTDGVSLRHQKSNGREQYGEMLIDASKDIGGALGGSTHQGGASGVTANLTCAQVWVHQACIKSGALHAQRVFRKSASH